QIGVELRHEVEGIRAAGGLTHTLRRRQTRRTWTIRTAIAAPVAASVAAAFLVTTAGQSTPGGVHQANGTTWSASGSPVQMQNVSYVRAQTIEALSQASQYVIFAKNTYASGHYDQWFDRATQRYRIDTYTATITQPVGEDGKIVLPDPKQIVKGPVARDQSISVSGPDGDQDIVTVDYRLRQWFTDHDAHGKTPSDLPNPTDPDSVRRAVADGELDLVGPEKVGGRNTLHLRVFGPDRSYRVDLWVDSTTYLPVQEAAAKGTGETGAQEFPASHTVTTRYSWLPRTEKNLAHLVVTAPPGFKHVR
ncbi:MAG TPA: hypothetical protein VIS06_00705, partial [Mycobacteriales bacterium]